MSARTSGLRLNLLWNLVLLVVLPLTSAQAHEIRPAIATVALSDKIEVAVSLNIEGLIAGIGPEHRDTNDAPEAATYAALRALPPDALRQRFTEKSNPWRDGLRLVIDGKRVDLSVATVDIPPVGDVGLARISTIRLTGALPADAANMTWTYPKASGSVILRVRPSGQEAIEGGLLTDGQTSANIPLKGGARLSRLAMMTDYMVLGFTHIVPKGLDHILFVLGLYFLSAGWKPLLLQVTAFTLAHSITLALGLYGVVDVSPRIVEPLIALSIVYVAVENILTDTLKPWRVAIVFLFGLLHGLGFAGILRDADLQAGQYLTALIGFNVGVEFGQLAVIAGAWLATGYWFSDKPWYRARVVWPASAVIALCGLGWTIERLFFA
jgi:tetrahydromethanopterin S-methyltransferase subunit F